MKVGDRVRFEDPYDGDSPGTVAELAPPIGPPVVAFIDWDDGTPPVRPGGVGVKACRSSSTMVDFRA
jgi:hypothetical protein